MVKLLAVLLILSSPAFAQKGSPIPKTCTAGQWLNEISDEGELGCSAVQWGQIASKPLDFPPSAHSHADGDIPNNITIDQATLALSGDSATAFFTTGTLEGARLSANVSLLGPTISGAELGNPAVGTKGGVEAITCGGTDKLSAIGTNGVPVCTPDQGGSGSGIPKAEINLMAITQTFTNLGAGFVESANLQSRTKFDFTGFTQVRVLTYQDAIVAAATGDLLIQCDTVSSFASPTTLASLDNVMAVRDFIAGNWVNISGECANADVFLRSGMSGGNTTEDPVLRSIRLQVR